MRIKTLLLGLFVLAITSMLAPVHAAVTITHYDGKTERWPTLQSFFESLTLSVVRYDEDWTLFELVRKETKERVVGPITIETESVPCHNGQPEMVANDLAGRLIMLHFCDLRTVYSISVGEPANWGPALLQMMRDQNGYASSLAAFLRSRVVEGPLKKVIADAWLNKKPLRIRAIMILPADPSVLWDYYASKQRIYINQINGVEMPAFPQ